MPVVCALAVTLSACGGNEGARSEPASDQPAETSRSVDAATKAEAQQVIDRATARLVARSTGHYTSTVDISGVDLVAEGRFDIDGKRGDWRLVQPALGRDGAENDEFAMRGMAIGKHLYGGPEFGPFQKCWFDYGTSGLAAIRGQKGADNSDPWYQPALIIASESRAVGFVDGRRDVIAVEVFADSALQVAFNKLMATADLPPDQVWAPATLTIRDGQFSEVSFKVGDALKALEDEKVDLTPPDGGEEQLEALRSSTQVTTYEHLGAPVKIEAPPADELMDASGMTAETPMDPEPCDAAR